MLISLLIRDLIVIDYMRVDFSKGLNIFTGETGAGKSILIDSLNFVLGWRGRGDLVRKGSDQAEVEAVFQVFPGCKSKKILEEAGLQIDDELILRRISNVDGRKVAWINDHRVSAELLRAVSLELVEFHGQSANNSFSNDKVHRELLDQYCENQSLSKLVGNKWKDLGESEKTLSNIQKRQDELQRDEEFLRHSVKELKELNVQPEEDKSLDERRRIIKSSEKLRENVYKACQLLGREAAEGAISDAMRWLDEIADHSAGEIEQATDTLAAALHELQFAVQTLEKFSGKLDFDPLDLERIEERLFAIRALSRKHQELSENLPRLLDSYIKQLNDLEKNRVSISEHEELVRKAKSNYLKVAKELTKSRMRGAKFLDKAMKLELPSLKMEKAVFETKIMTTPLGPHGNENVTFCVSTNIDSPPRPIAKIASGGEISRLLLALKVCLSASEDSRIVVFDEIDRGVGGATADAVGRRLQELGKRSQALVITHSPQVAAFANRHFCVTKHLIDGRTLSRVTQLNENDRVSEIARMISGNKVTSEALAAANALIFPAE